MDGKGKEESRIGKKEKLGEMWSQQRPQSTQGNSEAGMALKVIPIWRDRDGLLYSTLTSHHVQVAPRRGHDLG